ncbi:hypothetical protein [Nocardia nova]|uniref:hypothetical protein n=1 Tax=Nocardia nova TaxID=37330 RepID=UPI0011B066D2|nr:hypothetical protein [Nocardia nova]
MADYVDAVAYVCSTCGRRTRVNRRTGMIYSHTIPWSTTVCEASATLAQTPEGGDVPQRLEAADPPPPPPPSATVRRADTRGQSIRALRGGIPGSRRSH